MISLFEQTGSAAIQETNRLVSARAAAMLKRKEKRYESSEIELGESIFLRAKRLMDIWRRETFEESARWHKGRGTSIETNTLLYHFEGGTVILRQEIDNCESSNLKSYILQFQGTSPESLNYVQNQWNRRIQIPLGEL